MWRNRADGFGYFDMVVYTIEIDLDTLEVLSIQPRFRTDGSGFDMGGFHRGMPDLEYDRDVPSGFGEENDDDKG